MKYLILMVALATMAQSAAASPIEWPDQALPIVLAHPEFFGMGGDQQQTGAAGGSWQGNKAQTTRRMDTVRC